MRVRRGDWLAERECGESACVADPQRKKQARRRLGNEREIDERRGKERPSVQKHIDAVAEHGRADTDHPPLDRRHDRQAKGGNRAESAIPGDIGRASWRTERGRTGRSRWTPDQYKKKTKKEK